MTVKEWLIPGVIITLISSAASFGSSYAVKSYKIDQNDFAIDDLRKSQSAGMQDLKRDITSLLRESQSDTNDKLRRLDERLDKMGGTAADIARLQERCNTLEVRLSELRTYSKDVGDVALARYDSLNNKVNDLRARQRQIDDDKP